jgi:hypothetical protein
VLTNQKTPENVQNVINEWLSIDISLINERKTKLTELKIVLEENYPEITTDLIQLEQSLIRLEKAKIQ